jgi:hypothetical protein
MESISDVRYNTFAVIVFLVAENVTQIVTIFKKCCGRLKHSWSLDKKNDSFQNRKSRTPLLPRSGRPVAAVSPEMLQHADSIVRYDRCITTRQLALSFNQERRYYSQYS